MLLAEGVGAGVAAAGKSGNRNPTKAVGGGRIVNVNVAVPVPLPLVALSVTEYGLPASVPHAGVPEITPVVFTVKPDGNPAAAQAVIG